MGAIFTSEGQRRLQELEKNLHERLVAAEAKKPRATIEVHNRMPVGHEAAPPDEPDLSSLTAQAKRNFMFWQKRAMDHELTQEKRDKAKREILKLVPDWTPAEVRARRKTGENAKKFLVDDVRYGPKGERLVSKRLVEGY